MYFVLLLLAELALAQNNAKTTFLHPDSFDDMETREQVKSILTAMKPPAPGPRKTSFLVIPGGNGTKKPSKPPGKSIVELNKNVQPYMYEADMLLSVAQAQKIASASSSGGTSRARRAATTDPDNYWNINVAIPYFMDSSILADSSKYPLVTQAVQFWQTNTCLNFVNNPSGTNALRYYVGDGCWSYVGKQGTSTQDISIGDGCESLGTVCHETAHALGFYHQQSRYDRDQYIEVNLNNVDPSLQYNFVKLTPQQENNFGVPFDYSSVMEYDAYAFATDTSIPTITPIQANYENAMGQREAPVFSDIMMVNYLYNCSQRCSSRPPCQNAGIVNSRTCNTCLCPRQFSGSYCTGLASGSAMNCNGQILTATSSWQSFNATAGNPNDYNPNAPATDCYWHIKAPTGSKLSVYITNPSQCEDGCNFQSYELNMGDPRLGGMVMCCASSTLTSTGNLVTMRAKTTYNQARYTINYKIY